MVREQFIFVSVTYHKNNDHIKNYVLTCCSSRAKAL